MTIIRRRFPQEVHLRRMGTHFVVAIIPSIRYYQPNHQPSDQAAEQ